jgi:Domain of unknown function (DUF4184)
LRRTLRLALSYAERALPFIAAHAAAVLPLRKHFVFSALVIGSISPDLHYFAALAPEDKSSHTIADAFYFCLPSALAVLCLFHLLLKRPLISLAPVWHQARLAHFATPFRFGPAKRFWLILSSLLLGIFSHLLWDSFTHGRGWMVHHISILRALPLQQMGIHRPVYNFLQHISTFFGLALLIYGYVQWSRSVEPQRVPESLKLSARVKAGLVMGIVSGAAVLALWYAFEQPRHTHLSTFVAYATISFMTLTFVGLVGFSLYWHHGMRSTSPG